MLDNTIIFDSRIAEKYSIEEAIVIANLYGWIKHNATNGKNYHEGRYWTYNSLAAFAKYFPFWSESKVKRVLIDLAGKTDSKDTSPKHEPIIVKGNFNTSKFDRTVWYSFTDEFFAYLKSLGYVLNEEKQEETLPFSESDQMDVPPTDDQYQLNNPYKKKKETKKDKSFLSKKEDADFFASLLTLGIDEDVALEWMRLRKKNDATNSERSFNLVKRAMGEVTKRLNITPTNVIEICLARGWYGCQTSYFEKIKLSDFGITPISTTPQIQANKYEMIDEQGNRYYLQGYGKHKVVIPSDAPARPSETMFWSNYTKSWYQP